MNNIKCNNIFGFIFGHKFESRFDTEDITPVEVCNSMKETIGHYIVNTTYSEEDELKIIIDGFRKVGSEKKTYIHDVCVRCGQTILKQ